MKNLIFQKKIYLIISILSLLASPLKAEQSLSFLEVWQKIESSSAALKASQALQDSYTSAQSRGQLHWLPQVYVDAKYYRTDDPGASFVGWLEQRSVENTDFNPQTLNKPGWSTFTKGTLGVNLPLYEGGFRSSFVRLQQKMATAQEFTTRQTNNELYAQALISYGSIVTLEKQRKKISDLKTTLSRLMKSYQLGSSSNPVGHSGLLGMKALYLRLEGLLIQNQSQQKAHYDILYEMGVPNQSWTPQLAPVESVTAEAFKQDSTKEAYKTLSLKAQSEAAQEMAAIEKSRYLPRFGLFAETTLFQGDRKTDANSVYGLYLQWNLFNPNDFGLYKEAQLKSAASTYAADAQSAQVRAERKALLASSTAYKENIQLLKQSEDLMNQQSQVTERLFINGSISALQYAEVIHRRTDLIVHQQEAELGLLKSSAEILKYQRQN